MPTQMVQISREVQFSSHQVLHPRGTILLLHGYLQNGDTLFELLRNYLPSDWNILAPNGIFPLAQQYGPRLRLAYTWYLFDPKNDHYLIDMASACHYLAAFMASQNQAGLPLKVIGYSQGGYLAPFAAQHLSHVQQVIGINCRFRTEAITSPLPFTLDGLHGQDDVLVDPERARQCHQNIVENGTRGQFALIPNCGHRITPSLGHALRKWLA